MPNKLISVCSFIVLFSLLCSLNLATVLSQDKDIQDELEMRNILSGKVEILIPKSFIIMPEEMAKIKYPSERRPTLIFTNEKGSINVSFNYTSTRIRDNQIILFKQQMKGIFQNLYPSAVWIEDKMKLINGKNVGVFELITPAIDTRIYNLMFFTELDGKVLLCSFNCTEKEMTKWKIAAHQILKSLKIL